MRLRVVFDVWICWSFNMHVSRPGTFPIPMRLWRSTRSPAFVLHLYHLQMFKFSHKTTTKRKISTMFVWKVAFVFEVNICWSTCVVFRNVHNDELIWWNYWNWTKYIATNNERNMWCANVNEAFANTHWTAIFLCADGSFQGISDGV